MDASTTSTILTIAPWLGTALAAGVAVFERFRTNRAAQIKEETRKLDGAKDELASTLRAEINAWKDQSTVWKMRFESEKADLKEYREEQHALSKTAQARLLELTAENSELKVKTDMTPFHDYAQEQRKVNDKIVVALNLIIEKLNPQRA